MRILVSVLLVAGASAACGKVIGADDEGPPPAASPDATADAEPPGTTPDGAPVDAGHDDAHGPDGPKRLVFLSSATTTGNFEFQNVMKGAASADEECMAEASLSGIDRPFVAWLSTDDVDAIDRLTDGPPWALRDGTIVFASRAAVAASMLQVELDRDANGAVVVPNKGYVWTGTLADGKKAPNRCADWTSSTGTGGAGAVGAVDGRWTAGDMQGAAPCSNQFHVICFEQ